uniref:Uncharacterized protein n=1 Tax=Ciona savignyi TaxID=51511 RepID=H2Y6A2_CIOSA
NSYVLIFVLCNVKNNIKSLIFYKLTASQHRQTLFIATGLTLFRTTLFYNLNHDFLRKLLSFLDLSSKIILYTLPFKNL